MLYEIEIKLKAVKDCKKFKNSEVKLIFDKIEQMKYDLKGDIKKLTNFTPEYRLRVRNYRILFEIIGKKIIIHRIKHRKESY
jgi:mRNA interferase RelE/StbE